MEKELSQRGNILFLILLAVVLFAALSYAVTNSMRGGGNDASKESASAVAAQILQTGSLLENTISRARLMDGVPEYGFDLSGTNAYTQTASLTVTNATCTQSACRLLAGANGGPIAIPKLPASMIASGGNGGAAFTILTIKNMSTTASDLVMEYRYVTKELCDAYNAAAGITTILSDTAALGYGTYNSYSGTLTSFPANASGTVNGVAFLSPTWGQKAFCANHTAVGNVLIYVIMER